MTVEGKIVEALKLLGWSVSEEEHLAMQAFNNCLIRQLDFGGIVKLHPEYSAVCEIIKDNIAEALLSEYSGVRKIAKELSNEDT